MEMYITTMYPGIYIIFVIIILIILINNIVPTPTPTPVRNNCGDTNCDLDQQCDIYCSKVPTCVPKAKEGERLYCDLGNNKPEYALNCFEDALLFDNNEWKCITPVPNGQEISIIKDGNWLKKWTDNNCKAMDLVNLNGNDTPILYGNCIDKIPGSPTYGGILPGSTISKDIQCGVINNVTNKANSWKAKNYSFTATDGTDLLDVYSIINETNNPYQFEYYDCLDYFPMK